jgi:hypothetical protein
VSTSSNCERWRRGGGGVLNPRGARGGEREINGMGEGMRGKVEWGGGRGLFLENKILVFLD